jgi:hypothetical protein
MGLREDLLREAAEAGMTDDESARAFVTAEAIIVALEKLELAFAGLAPPAEAIDILATVAQRVLDSADDGDTALTDYLLQLLVLAKTTVTVHRALQTEFMATQPAAEGQA